MDKGSGGKIRRKTSLVKRPRNQDEDSLQFLSVVVFWLYGPCTAFTLIIPSEKSRNRLPSQST